MVWRSTPWLAAESLPNVQNLSQLLTIPTMCPRQPMGFSTRHIHDTEATMTETPDPGLTDLIAAHTLRIVELNEAARYPECNGCDWVGGLMKDHAAHLSSIVKQYAQDHLAIPDGWELWNTAQLERFGEEQERNRQSMRDTIARWRTRAEEGEATIARVEALRDNHRMHDYYGPGQPFVAVYDLRAALEGEQQ